MRYPETNRSSGKLLALTTTLLYHHPHSTVQAPYCPTATPVLELHSKLCEMIRIIDGMRLLTLSVKPGCYLFIFNAINDIAQEQKNIIIF